MHWDWRWVFFVCVPFAVISFIMLVFSLHERVERRVVAPIDWSGAALLSTGLSALPLDRAGRGEPGSALSLLLGGVTVSLLAGFVLRELRAEDPILPMQLMVRPVIACSMIGNFLLGGILFGIETFVPLFIQGVRGGNAQEAGQALTPLFLTWAVSVVFAARAVVRWGFRRGGMFGGGVRRRWACWCSLPDR